MVARWRTLPEEHRAAWAAGTDGVNSRPQPGPSGRLSGYLFFLKINLVLYYQALELRETTPERPTFAANPVGSLVATNTGGVPEFKLSGLKALAAQVLVLATGPCSAGVSFAQHYAILDVLPAAEAG